MAKKPSVYKGFRGNISEKIKCNVTRVYVTLKSKSALRGSEFFFSVKIFLEWGIQKGCFKPNYR